MRGTLRALVVVGIAGGTVHPQSLDDAAVTAAIKAGETKKFSALVSDCNATAGFGAGMAAAMAGGLQRDGAFGVVVSLAAGRIAFAAAEAKRLYKPFTADDVPAELRRTDRVFVSVTPASPSSTNNTISVASPIQRVVLKSKTKSDRVAQPQDVVLEPVEWSNLLGGKVQGNSAIATFQLGEVRELPPGEIDVIVITEHGERRCKIGTKDRDRILK